MLTKMLKTVLAAATAAAIVPAAAAAFPDRPVNYIIPFDPGGESDIAARIQQSFFTELTGQNLVVQYQPGAGGAQAWSVLNDQPGDGHVIMGTNLPHLILQPMLQTPGYATDDIVNVYMFHYTPDALIVRADSEFETLEELIAHAEANPGQVTVAGTGTNTAPHIANQLFMNETGVTTTYIPYTGTGATTTALLGGEVAAQWGYTTVAVAQGDQVRMLAVAQDERNELYPDVPTFSELGIAMIGGAYRGVAVPQSTPEDVRERWSEIIGEINTDPEFVERMEQAGFAMLDVDYAGMADFMAERRAVYEEVAAQLGQN
ncbi:tripartite tricarboxylate transporter substrate binding protein [soil metagenome]